jgi:hypothetical protein
MRDFEAAVIVASLQEAEAAIAAGADDVVFALTVQPRSSRLDRERIPRAASASLAEWARFVTAHGARPHIQIRDLGLDGRCLREGVELADSLEETGFSALWTGDAGLLTALHGKGRRMLTVADWRLPLTNARSCQLALSAGADGVSVAPPFPEWSGSRDTGYLVIQGSPSLDPRTDGSWEFFTSPFILSDLESQSFTYATAPAEFSSELNRRLRSLEGEWRAMLCPFPNLEAQAGEWRGWGCAACWIPGRRMNGPLKTVVELPGAPGGCALAMRVLSIAASASSPEAIRRAIADDPGLGAAICGSGSRCRFASHDP